MQQNLHLILITLSILLTSFHESPTTILHREHLYLVDTHFHQGQTWMECKNYAIAQKYFDTHTAHLTTSHSPHTVAAYYYGGLCAIKLAHVDGEERLQQLITQFPTHYFANVAHYDLGNFYCTQQDYSTGIKYYLGVDATALPLPLQTTYSYNLAYAYLHDRNFSEAWKGFNKCKQLNTHYTAASNYYAGYLALKAGDYPHALTDLQAAQKHSSYAGIVPYLIMEALYQSKDYAGVIAYAQELANKPLDCVNKEDIALLTAEAHFLLQNYQPAITQYENYLALADKAPLPDVKFRIGYSLYETKAYHKAIKYFKALALQEDYLGQLGCYYLGMAYMRTKQKNLALSALQEAAKLDFDADISAEAAFHYAQLSCELGYEGIAIEALQTFKQIYPKNRHMPEVDKLLSELYLRTKNYDLAITHIDSLSQKNHTMRQVYQKATLYKGSNYYNQADYTAAITWLHKSIAYPLDKALTAQAHFWLAESYAAQQAYEQAVAHYQAVMTTLQPNHTYHQDATYGLAYSYFNMGAYPKALPLFLQYAKAIKTDHPWKIDALIRAADCYYATKAYQHALKLYAQTYKTNPAHSSYHKALIYILLGNQTEAEKNLTTIINTAQKSLYYEQALYEYAYLALQYQSYETAIAYFTRLIEEKPHHAAVPNALLYRAIAYVNIKQYAAAEDDYVTLLQHYPTHPATENALLELPKLTNLMRTSEKLQQYTERYTSNHPNNEKLPIIALETAKNLLYSQNYPQAIEQLEAFIIQYSDSVMIEEAYFLLAEAYYRLGDMLQALGIYQKIDNQHFPSYNKVLLRIGTIAYKQQDFAVALSNYTTLLTRATSKKEQYYALEGMMRANAALQHYDEVKKIGQRIINLGTITVNGTREAILYSAKASMQQGLYEEALQHLQELSAEQDVYAAEAQLLTAQIYYQIGDYKQSLEILFAFTKQQTYHKHLAEQGFLWIAENYIALQETFQAKATLQSIIDHTTDKAMADTATSKLRDLMQANITQEDMEGYQNDNDGVNDVEQDTDSFALQENQQIQ